MPPSLIVTIATGLAPCKFPSSYSRYAEFLEDSCSCIETLNQPHDDNKENAEGVVNEVNDNLSSWKPLELTLLRTVMLRMVPVNLIPSLEPEGS